MANVIAYFNDIEGGICQRINRLSRLVGVRRFFALIGFWLMMAAVVFAIQGPASLPAILQIAVTGIAGVLIYKALKSRLVRERPYINRGDILCGTAPLDRYSFPSGHTLHAVSFSIMLSQAEPALIPVVAPFALLVAASRVVLGLHYPSDVVVGAVIGAALANSSLALF